jgi:uncharacterized protein (TIGR02466 family)
MIRTFAPKTVYVVDNVGSSEERDVLAKECRMLFVNHGWKRPGLFEGYSLYSDYNQIQLEPPFKQISEFILHSAKKHACDIGYSKYSDKLHILSMWANMHTSGGFIWPHTHTECMFSAVYYLKSPENSSLTFSSHDSFFFPSNTETTDIYSKSLVIDTLEGRLIIFRSDLTHETRHIPEGEKIAISCNIGFKFV